ncbi:MAG: 2-amino-4-hydroxy-6-hydroxymethyldihydropteridine diphosphokinase [Candidatus Aminicenantes bacterium]|nr:2-amino-4-hydroxy-6-hydroxymethyldihydropteridine diphosphokinase [Candidatus Aminicenantes bacterium]
MKYFLSLGSNLGDRAEHLNRAIAFLEKEGCGIVQVSSVYETQPIDYIDQPWFLNQVIEIKTERDYRDLLSLVKRIEMKIGRKKTVPKGPRIIDIDILLYEKNVIKTKKLTIPHPMLEKRNFVLIPLSEIAPDIIHPVLNEKIKELVRISNDRSCVNKFDPSRIKIRKHPHND